MMKRLLSLLLAGILIFSLVPAQVLATDGTEDTAPSEEATAPTVMLMTDPVNSSDGDDTDPSEQAEAETTEAPKSVWKVTFDAQGGTPAPSEQNVTDGEKAAKPAVPEKDGFIFGGWYDENGKEWHFSTPVTNNVNLTAKWKVTVTFDSRGGTSVSSQEIPVDGKVSEPTPPTYGSRVFGGWYDSNDILWDFEEDTVSVNTTLHADWLIRVTFMDGAKTLGELGVENKGKISESDVPAKKGFALTGLYKDAALTIPWDYSNDTVKETTKLYTDWIPFYTVTFDTNNVSKVDSQSVKEGEKATRPSDPTSDKFVFDDWYADSEFKVKYDFSKQVNANTTVYAKWKVKVTFDSKGGGTVASQTLDIGQPVTKPTDPTKSQYVFDGWFNGTVAESKRWNFDTDTVTANTILCAGWKAEVTFDSNGGYFDNDSSNKVVKKTTSIGKTVSKPNDPSRDGFFFGGWYDKDGNEWISNTTKVNQNITLYAKWNVKVSFVSNCSVTVDDQFVAEGGKIGTAPVPTNPGHALEGWYKDEALTEAWNFATDTFTENITLYAKWEEAVNVIFDKKNGTAHDIVPVGIGKTVSKPEDPKKNDHEFAGWYKDENCTDPWDFKTEVTQSITLYAKWLEVFDVTFNSNGGSKDSADEVTKGSTVTEPTAPTRNNYVFGGWYADKELTDPWDFKTDTVEGNTTLYAKWNLKVIFDTDGGSPVPVQGVEKDGKVTEPEKDPTKTNFVFGGWYDEYGKEWDFEKNTINRTTTIYAKWMVRVTFDSKGGSVIDPNTVTLEIGEKVSRPEDNPVKSNSEFVGWYYKEGSAEKEWKFADPVNTNKDLYAKWTDNPLKISPTSKELYPGETVAFTAKYNNNEDVTSKVTWDVDGTDSDTKFSGATLTIGEDEEAGTIRVIATYSGASDFAEITVKPTYDFKSGSGGKWAQKSTKSLTFECSGPYDEFEKVTIGSTTVSSTNFTTEESSYGTKLTLKSGAMSSLAVGEHKLTIYYKDGGRAITTFEVIKESDIPETGDFVSLPLWCMLLAVTAAAALMLKKRQA